MKILYLAHRIPYPPNKGDKIRSFHEIKYLAKSHLIDLVCFADNPGDVHFQEDLKKYCCNILVVPLKTIWAIQKGLAYLASGRALSVGYFYSKKIQQTVDRWLFDNDYEAVFCFSSPMAEYLFRSRAFWTGRTKGKTPALRDEYPRTENSRHMTHVTRRTKLLMDFCDVDSDKWAQYASLALFPKSFAYRLENRRLASYERKIAEQFDYSVVCSEKEADLFMNQNPHITDITVIPNGVDYQYFSPEGSSRSNGIVEFSKEEQNDNPGNRQQNSPVCLFTGAMDYHANVDGVTWFCKRIFPRLRATFPNAQFYIVGGNPARKLQGLGDTNGIKVTGFVEDIRPYYHMADVCVVPLRLARGVQNKVLEAMAMGKAVVATSKAIAGINAIPGEHLLVEDNAKGFADAVSVLLKDLPLRTQLAAKARRFVKVYYNWQVNMKKFEDLLHGDLIKQCA